MQLSIVTLLSLTSAAFAGPMSLHMVRDCDALSCASGLGPIASGCVSAATQLGVDPVSDVNCLGTVLNSVASPPASCSGCGGGIIDDIEGAFDNVKNGIEGLF
ncbi:hypothetical protein M422DRAFT_252996 [Sphaerobolus stellatus SS14]|uniref:Fungal calcium binding protein domain-containing protein n=1 Tax=Sphaerobolus stellatus (strain SS14) TaxID=990650 RepID=A0A0C9V9U8_SPHS4|nr:hypothetical protein M422DRAFT_252996 [Sphaerobolus stellatus SS14]